MKSADAIFTNPTRSLTHTYAMRHARDAGARVIMLGAGDYITQDTLYRIFPTSKKEIDDMAILTEKVGATHKGTVHVTSPDGTDLTLEVGKLTVHINTGLAHEKGCCEVLPPGETSAGVTEESANGKIVFDGSIIPIYHPLTEPIRCKVKDNFIVEIEGGSDARQYKKYLEDLNDPQVYNIAEFGIGTNPKCRLSGTPLEDERIFGAVHIGIGTNINFGGNIKAKTHTDGMIMNPTVEIDSQLILKNGEFQI
jgi:leucyl aminopeptidase (aminopeptidase T)